MTIHPRVGATYYLTASGRFYSLSNPADAGTLAAHEMSSERQGEWLDDDGLPVTRPYEDDPFYLQVETVLTADGWQPADSNQAIEWVGWTSPQGEQFKARTVDLREPGV